MYSSIPFGLAQCTVELPYVLAQCFLFGTISYWMISFQPSAGGHPLPLPADMWHSKQLQSIMKTTR